MIDQQQRVARWLRAHARRSFGPGFDERVMRRIAGREVDFRAAVAALFPRLASATLALLLAAGAYCLWGAEDRTSFEALVGLAPVSLETAYELDLALIGNAPTGERQ